MTAVLLLLAGACFVGAACCEIRWRARRRRQRLAVALLFAAGQHFAASRRTLDHRPSETSADWMVLAWLDATLHTHRPRSDAP